MSPRRHRVRSVDLSVDVLEHTAPAPGRPHVVLVHGFPERQQMWQPVLDRLGEDFHTITYDVRGAGASETPGSTDGYRTELLVEDLIAVVEATVPSGEPFHLVGHDWGSVQLWDVLAAEPVDDRLTGRISSYTSISGPPLDHVAGLLRRSRGRRLATLNQAVHSAYVGVFQLPWLPELMWTRLQRPLRAAMTRLDPGTRHLGWGANLAHDGRNGVELYRANIRRRLRHPRQWVTDVPVRLVVPRRDRYVTEVLLEDLGDRCARLERIEINAGHWAPTTHPDDVAALLAGHVRAHS